MIDTAVIIVLTYLNNTSRLHIKMAKIKLETVELNKKPPETLVLDLWNVKIQTKQEFRNIIEKIPTYNIHEDSVSVRDKKNLT